MGIKKITVWATAILLFSSLSATVFATEAGFYMGLQIGMANLNNLEENINTGQASHPLLKPCDPTSPFTINGTCVVTATTPTNTGMAERLYLGSNINRYAGFEVGMAIYTPTEYAPDVSGYTHQPHIWEYSADILGKVMLPLGRFSVFGKGGIAFVYKSVSPAIFESDETNTHSVFFVPAFGAGIAFQLTPNWEIDVSAMRIQGTEDLQNIDFYGVGISYHLVDEYCGQFLC